MNLQWLRKFNVDVTFCRELLKKHESRSDVLMHESRVTHCGKITCDENAGGEYSGVSAARKTRLDTPYWAGWKPTPLLRLEDHDPQRRELDRQLVGPHVPAGFFGLDAGEVADVAAAVELASRC